LLFIYLSFLVFLHFIYYSTERSIHMGRFRIKRCLQNRRGTDVGRSKREHTHKTITSSL
jgi:hypothetical protein